MGLTSIEWTDRTWNPVRGCSMVSAGCARCYAMKQAHRFSGSGKAYEGLTELGPDGPRWTGKVRTVPDLLDQPLRWRKPARIFVNSMSDLFRNQLGLKRRRNSVDNNGLAERGGIEMKMKDIAVNCDCCGELIDPRFGVATCPECGGIKCVQFCIPSGNRTACLDCEGD